MYSSLNAMPHSTKSPRIRVFYNEKMSLTPNYDNSSRSPEKPKRLMEYLAQKKLLEHFNIDGAYEPFETEDFYIAHEKAYVDSFFSEALEPRYQRMLGLKWSAELAETTRYTTASLYYAILHSIQHPEEVCLSPVCGFHHAFPRKGALYCCFSGQVIASTRIYREHQLSGCYIDLDGHYGNSIDNSYGFVPDLEQAIPPEIGNININACHRDYLDELSRRLKVLEQYITDGKIHYVVFCHGADSHEWDDLGHQLTTDEWVECSEMVYDFVGRLEQKLNRPIPLSLALFGGYRKDDYNSVLALHTADLVTCLNVLCGQHLVYTPAVKENG